MTRKIEAEDSYKPVAFDPKAYAAEKCKTDPDFRAIYDALGDEFAALAARKDSCLRLRWQGATSCFHLRV